MKQQIAPKPYWMDSASLPSFPKLERDEQVDVVVVGAGITGLTAAYLLTKAGRTVAVLDRNDPVQGDTGYTSAHLTMVTDAWLSELVDRFGRDHAQAVWDAGLAAHRPDRRHRAGREHRVRFCMGARLSSQSARRCAGKAGKKDAQAFRDEAALAGELGFDAAYLDDVPFAGGPGVVFENQARFHPRKYLAGVARAIAAAGGHIYRRSAAEEFSDKPLSVKANGHTITCRDIVLATHNAPDGQYRDGERDALPDEAGPLLHLRRRRARAEGAGARRAVLGLRGSLPLPADRAACGPRSRHLRRRGSQDRPGRRHERVLRTARTDADEARPAGSS